MIKVEGLIKRYGFITAVNGVSFELDEGDVLGLVGPNGAGKTTTLKSILGLIIPDSGVISIDGENPRTNPSIKRKLGYVPELPEAPKWPRVCELLEKLAILEGASRLEARRLARQASQRVGIFDYCNYKVGKLSKGLKKRLLIAQAIINPRRYLILDEPVAGLDPEWVAEVRRLVMEYAREGVGILISSHILKELEDIVTRIVIINRGRLLFAGTLRDLAEKVGGGSIITIKSSKSPLLARFLEERGYKLILVSKNLVKIEVTGDTNPKEILTTVEEGGFPIEGFEYSHISLEDAYLKLVRELK